jgi:hypothetical protein
MEEKHIKKEFESIEIPSELSQRVRKGIMQAKMEKENERKARYKKPMFVWGSVAILFFAVLIGTSLVSPSVSTLASKIPLLNKIFNQEPVENGLFKILADKGFKAQGYFKNPKEFIISTESNDFQSDKEKIKSISEEYLEQQGYNEVSIQVINYKDEIVPSSNPSSNKLAFDKPEFIMEIGSRLEEIGLTNFTYSKKRDPLELTLSIPESIYNSRKEEIVQIVTKVGDEMNIEDFIISFDTFKQDERDRNSRWAEIIGTLNEAFINYPEYPIKSFGFSVDDKVRLYIQLDKEKNQEGFREDAMSVRGEIEAFLTSNEVQKKVKGDQYLIEFRDKNNKKVIIEDNLN